MEEIRNDREIQTIQENATSLQQKIQAIEVTDESSSKLASTWLGFLAQGIKKLEDKRTFFKKPILEAGRNIDNEFRTMIEPLEKLSRLLKDKVLSYNRLLQAQIEERKKTVTETAKELGLPVPEESEMELQTAKPATVKTTLGTTFSTKRWAWKVIDETKIPREYFMLDEKKISGLMRAHQKNIHGVKTMELKIDGIEFYQEEDISVRT